MGNKGLFPCLVDAAILISGDDYAHPFGARRSTPKWAYCTACHWVRRLRPQCSIASNCTNSHRFTCSSQRSPGAMQKRKRDLLYYVSATLCHLHLSSRLDKEQTLI